MRFKKYNAVLFCAFIIVLFAAVVMGCGKNNDGPAAPYTVDNFLTIFKLDNVKNNVSITPTDTIASMSGLQGKYIPISGNTGAVAGLGKISLQLFTTQDSLLSSLNITQFFRPEYHVFNTQLPIPAAARGNVYKVVVTSYDKDSVEVGKQTFFGVDVLTCDPVPACIVPNQITIMLETPAGTPPDDALYIFGSINGWGTRDDPQYMFHKNPDMNNCYCLSIPYAPGYTDWQLTQIFVSRGTWETQEINNNGDETYSDYTITERGPIWKIKVIKWRDQ